MKKHIELLFISLLAASTTLSACTHAAPKPTAQTATPTVQDDEATAAVPALAHTSIAELERLSAEGDLKAQLELGTRYGLGKGVPRSYDKAIALIQPVAEKNDPVAQFFLGTAYYHGAGVPKDEAAAVLWTERAADQGLAIAQYWMGLYIATGTGGISKSMTAAMPYFWKAALQGNSMAAFYLGNAYNKGPDVDRNVKAAAYWYRRASDSTLNAQAYFELALLIKNKEIEWQPGDPVLPPPAAPSDQPPKTSP